MGTFTKPGCRDWADALWHINKAREHDGLAPLTLEDIAEAASQPRNSSMRAHLNLE